MAAIASESVLARLPIIVILGATGTGKSKLALQVAKRFNGEIVSADAMQVYRGLDIVTNKVTAEEVREVPHHMIDYLGPGRPATVVDFRDKALPVIEKLQERGKLPVVAGGTCYYVESLLWNTLMTTPTGEPPAKRAKCWGDLGGLSHLIDGPGGAEVDCLTAEDKVKLHAALREADPDRAVQLHPNNVRKVIRSLQVLHSTGRRHSELIKEQRSAGGNHLSGPLRFPHSLILWISCDKEVLDGRLDARVDQMIEHGLINELQEFHKQYNLQRVTEDEIRGGRTADYTQGIFQSIGFKEFHNYLMLSKEEQQSDTGQELFRKGVELMKLATRQYARRQNKWIRHRFLTRADKQVPPVYMVDGTNVSQWDSQVRDKAFSVVQSVLDGSPSPVAPEPRRPAPIHEYKMERCEQCDRVFTTTQQWEQHLTSQKHRRKVNKLNRLAAGNTVGADIISTDGKT